MKLEPVRGDLLRDLPEWLEEFTDNLVDDRVPVHRDAPASSCRESASELRKVDTHFPKDRNCLEPTRKPNVIYTDNSLEFGKACAEIFWNLCTLTPHRIGN